MRLTKTTRTITWLTFRGLTWLFWAPIVFAINVVRFWKLRPLFGDAMACVTCQSRISLLSLWECHCGWRFYGWYWSRCEVCGDIPSFVECGRCGATTMNPMIFG